MKTTLAVWAVLGVLMTLPALAAPHDEGCGSLVTGEGIAILHYEFDARDFDQDNRPHLHDLEKLCYAGEPAGVKAAIEQLIADGALAEYVGLLAIRTPQSTEILDQDLLGEKGGKLFEVFAEDSAHPRITRRWNRYNPSSGEVLVISNLAWQGDGTEMYLSVIPRCQ